MATSSASKSVKVPVVSPAPTKNRATKAPDISILVPVMNEGGNIRPLIEEICATFSGRQFEIIYIDDAIDDEDDESHKPNHPSSTDEEQPPPSEEQDTSAYGTTSEATV